MERWSNMGFSFGWPGVIAMAINNLLRRPSGVAVRSTSAAWPSTSGLCADERQDPLDERHGIRIIIVMSAADELLQNALAALRGGQPQSALALYKQVLSSDFANFTAL